MNVLHRFFRRFFGRTARRIWENRLLALVAVGFLLAWPVIPDGHVLARPDLLPWAMTTLGVGLFLRGDRLGQGAHPLLGVRSAPLKGQVRRGAAALVPWALLSWYDAGFQLALPPIVQAIALSIGVAVALAWGSEDGLTAWNPPGPSDLSLWGLGGGLLLTAAMGAGALEGWLPLPPWMTRAFLVGLGFLGGGLAFGRGRHFRQRLHAAGAGATIPILLFRAGFAFFGPFVTLWGLALALHYGLSFSLDFSQAWLLSWLLLVWVAVIWPPPVPEAVLCLLHEVVPEVGSPEKAEHAASALPPEGALRLNPLRIQRTRAMHPWVVPVRDARIRGFDDPVRPIWPTGSPPLSAHILGDAAFEADPATNEAQEEVITIRLSGRSDVATLQDSDAQARRLVVLRAYAPGWGATRTTTYRWEDAIPEGTVQVVDAATERLTLRDGDIIVLSAEGVARVYELEIGAAVPRAAALLRHRAPQVEDYTEVG